WWIVVQDLTMRRPVFGSVGEVRTPTAVDRRANQTPLAVIVGSLRIDSGIEAGKAVRPLLIHQGLGIGQAQEVEEERSLAMMHPVIRGRELPVNLPILGPLPGDGFPLPAGQTLHRLAAAEGIEK